MSDGTHLRNHRRERLLSTSTAVVVLGEINLDVYATVLGEPGLDGREVDTADTIVCTGGNTWNIARILSALGLPVTFLCTSSARDVTASVLRTEGLPTPTIKYIPRMETLAPRFIAVDRGEESVLRAIHIPPQQAPDARQLAYAKAAVLREAARGARLAILASSIEPVLLAALVRSCEECGLPILATISSSPSALQYRSLLSRFACITLNEHEARALLCRPASVQGEALAREIARYRTRCVLTCGHKGAWYAAFGNRPTFTKAPRLGNTFVNSLGAGDTMAAYLALGLWKHDGAIRATTLARATAAAALICQARGHLPSRFDKKAMREMLHKVRLQNTPKVRTS